MQRNARTSFPGSKTFCANITALPVFLDVQSDQKLCVLCWHLGAKVISSEQRVPSSLMLHVIISASQTKKSAKLVG